MTAEEFIEKEYPIMSDQDDWWWWEDKIYEAMKEYARIKCEEQKDLCANKFLKSAKDTRSAILNAPEPKFD
jgi:hypothetical protein